MIGLLLLACAAAAFGLDAPWWLRGLLVTPALVLGAGSGLARWLGGTQDRLAHLLQGEQQTYPSSLSFPQHQPPLLTLLYEI